jgi:hypothetical protein
MYDSLDTGWYQNDIASEPSADLRFQEKVHRIQAAAMTAMVRNGLMLDAMLPVKVLASLIRVFDSQVMSLM